MEKEKPRIARLTSILTQLQSKRLVTARELAEKHGVSTRSIYRDIRTLEQSGIPIYTQEGKGYRIMEGYQLPPIMFSEQEANALITAQQIINKNRDDSLKKQFNNAITKIKAVMKHSQKDKSHILEERLQIRSYNKEKSTSNHLIQLQTTITNYSLVHITYNTLDNIQSERDIEPFALYHTQNNWVLIAYCRLRMEFRAFRLDRIEKLFVTSIEFEPHQITLQQYFEEAQLQWENKNKPKKL